MKQFIHDLFANPDGSGSTKRTAGWLLLFVAIAVGVWLGLTSDSETVQLVVFGSLLAGGLAAFGISSADTASYFKHLKR